MSCEEEVAVRGASREHTLQEGQEVVSQGAIY